MATDFCFPINFREMDADGLQRLREACDGEIKRRAFVAARTAARRGLPANSDTDDAIFEAMDADQLGAVARVLDADVSAAGQRVGGHAGGLA